MRFIGVAAGPPVASVMLKPSAGPFFYLAAGLGGIGILLSAFALKPKEDQAAES
ncbi:hypothetical protein D3C81_2296060 [compost metagenome]